MLEEIRIKNFALISELDMSFKSGLNIITGETGAGKSIIIEAINLLVGGRADVTRIRQGARSAEIEGLFVLDDGQEFALRRTVNRDGKNRSFINGQIATTGQLAKVGDSLLDIHGQHEHQSLLKPQTHLDLIDRFGGRQISEAKSAYTAALLTLRSKQKELSNLKAIEEKQNNSREALAWQIKELSQAELIDGEDEDLEKKINRLKKSAKIFEAVGKARQYLDEGVTDNLYLARGELSQGCDADSSLGDVMRLLESAGADIEEAGRSLAGYCEALAFDEGQLEAFQERFFFLSDLKKKYGLSIEGLKDRLDRAQTEMSEVDNAEAAKESLLKEIEESLAKVKELAGALSALRGKYAKRFVGLIREHLRDLAMGKGDFEIRLEKRDLSEREYGPDGVEQAEFVFSANTGETLQPLARIASGGELARVMLAMRTVFSRTDGTPTLIFDEIDAGIGGKTAVKIGERLAMLCLEHQIICVTHLAQIAAFADHHFGVRKRRKAGTTVVSVKEISGTERLSELARLGGLLDESTVSVEHARQLLSQAADKKSMVVADE